MYIFVDTDPGIDDFLALSYIFSQTNHDIVGMSSVAGNVNLDFTTRNLQLITGIFNKKYNKNVTIFKGISKPLVQVDNNEACLYHGDDGLAGFWSSDYFNNHKSQVEEICKQCTISEVPAVFGLIELSKKYSGELVILGLGPLGNIALAQIIDPDFGSRLKEIFIMGGDISGHGNCSIHPSSEFNFSADPEAAYVVFKEIKCKKTCLPLETVFELSIPVDQGREWLKQLECKTDLVSIIIHMIINYDLRKNKNFRWYDLVLAVCFAEPEIVKEMLTCNATLELNGKYTRGKVVIDFFNKRTPNDFQDFNEVNFIKSLNYEDYLKRVDSFVLQ